MLCSFTVGLSLTAGPGNHSNESKVQVTFNSANAGNYCSFKKLSFNGEKETFLYCPKYAKIKFKIKSISTKPYLSSTILKNLK